LKWDALIGADADVVRRVESAVVEGAALKYYPLMRGVIRFIPQ
jgi:hypothetical protein